MELLPYTEFALLRMKGFWPETAKIDWFDGYGTRVGYARGEVYGYAYFVRNRRVPDDVAEIALESLGPDSCPEGAADRLLARLNLPLAAGMTIEEVTARLGDPVERTTNGPDRETHLMFVCGGAWPYCIFCVVWPDRGLQYIAIVRKDLYDRQIAIDASDDDDADE